jgi:hypothetical protein
MEKKEYRISSEMEYGRFHLGTLGELQRTRCIGPIPDANGCQGMAGTTKKSDKDVTSKESTIRA